VAAAIQRAARQSSPTIRAQSPNQTNALKPNIGERTTNTPILPSRPSWLLQYLASSQIRCPGNVKAIRSPCSKSRIVQGGGKRRWDGPSVTTPILELAQGPAIDPVARRQHQITAPSSAGPSKRLQPHNNARSNPIGENANSTARWHDVPRGTMDEVRSHVRLDRRSSNGEAARKIGPPRSRIP
jgi:hypothetical protein